MTDLEISKKTEMLPIREVAKKINISEDDLEFYGKYKAKLPLKLIDESKINSSNLILVTAINPTPAGEGKTTVSIGLNEGLNILGKKSIAVLREPSLGPVFGMKGGATGGGHSQVGPMEDINLHFTGDFSAIEKANNFLSAIIDNVIHQKNHAIKLDPKSIRWKRCMDMNDRSLRNIVIGMGDSGNGVIREDGFNITAASEIMAILCLSKNIGDLKIKLGNILVGFTYDNRAVFARDLKVTEAMTILLKEAIKPNLVQTLEGNPAILHGGPFANIAQGTNSIIATKMGLSLADYVVTEAGFGADLGAEKFLNIKCQYENLNPKAIVLVATIRALKHHGGALANELTKENLDTLKIGFSNLKQHIENCQKFGIKPIVAINQFSSDTTLEINLLIDLCNQIGIEAVLSNGWAEGGKGCLNLAKTVINTIELNQNRYKPLYNWKLGIKEKINCIAKEIYKADGVEYSQKAEKDLIIINKLGLDVLPICMAKTQKSFSDNENKLGAPKGFTINVREFEIASGAGFIIPILGNMLRMPGLPNIPASEGMRINEDGEVFGIS